MQPAERFTDEELACRCGCGLLPDMRSVERLYALRHIYGKPIVVNSGARCRRHNKEVGGAPDSAHLVGAYDIRVPNSDELHVMILARSCGFNGIGVWGDGRMHLDDKHESGEIWKY